MESKTSKGVLKDHTSSNCDSDDKKKLSKTKRRKLRSDQKQTKQKELSEEIDLDAIIEDKRQNELDHKQRKEKRKVENCPHIIKQDSRFMCSSCRMMCCEPCLVVNHKGHRWCELMPYEPSEEELSTQEDTEVPVQINTRGKRRLPGGFISTRRLGSHRERDKEKCSRGCSGCCHDPKSLKRLVPIDESRFEKKLSEIENGSSDNSLGNTDLLKNTSSVNNSADVVKENSATETSKESESSQTISKKKKNKKKKRSDKELSDTDKSVMQESNETEEDGQEKTKEDDQMGKRVLSREISGSGNEKDSQNEDSKTVISEAETKTSVDKEENKTEELKREKENGEHVEKECIRDSASGSCKNGTNSAAEVSTENCSILSNNDESTKQDQDNSRVKSKEVVQLNVSKLCTTSTDNFENLMQTADHYDLRCEVMAKIKKYDDDSGEFARAVSDWLKIPESLRIVTTQEAWVKMGSAPPKEILYRLSPTEREKFMKQCARLIEKQEMNPVNKISDMMSGLETFKKLQFKSGVPSGKSEMEIERRFNLVMAGIEQIKKRYIRMFEKTFREMDRYHILIDAMALPPDEEKFYLSQAAKPYVVPDVTPNTNGVLPFGEPNEEIEAAIKFLKLDRSKMLDPDVNTLEQFLLTKLDPSMLKDIVGPDGSATDMFADLRNQEEGLYVDPFDCIREVDMEEMEQDELSREIVIREQRRMQRHMIRSQFNRQKIQPEEINAIRRNNAPPGLEMESFTETEGAQLVIADISELAEMIYEGSRKFPYIGKKKQEQEQENVPADVYSVCNMSPNLSWMHKIGHETNSLVNREGNVIREVNFGTSTESLALTDEKELLASDPLDKRILKVSRLDKVIEFLKFDDLMPLGICWTKSKDLLVCFTKCYYDYNVMSNNRRLVARVDTNGKFLQEIEFDANEKSSCYFMIPARVKEGRNGDICVVDRLGKNHGRLLIFNENGNLLRRFDGMKSFDRPFDPRDVDFDKNNNLLICDYANNSIIIVLPTYNTSKVISVFDNGLRYPLALSVDSMGWVWAGCKCGKVIIIAYDTDVKKVV